MLIRVKVAIEADYLVSESRVARESRTSRPGQPKMIARKVFFLDESVDVLLLLADLIEKLVRDPRRAQY